MLFVACEVFWKGQQAFDMSKRSAFSLVILSLLGLLFFWITDPTFGPAMRNRPTGAFDLRFWLFRIRGSPENLVDAGRQMLAGTLFGLAGCAAMLAIGVWLVMRRRA